jgi:hypothetical protein
LSRFRSELALLDPGETQFLARRVAEGIRSLDPTMSRYCELTCPQCEDPCCTGHEVFFNQADLLYLAAMQGDAPPGQTRTRATDPCRYLEPGGCALARSLRPYVCVWFLCDAQMQCFREETAGFQRQFIRTLQEIRSSRLRLERAYEGCANR